MRSNQLSYPAIILLNAGAKVRFFAITTKTFNKKIYLFRLKSDDVVSPFRHHVITKVAPRR